ncbi:MAG: hypothetical protein H5U25_05565 [Oceanibaculum nanhaiense]|nr:hypothetical protein [Oceanibaculum nanhaiense]
MPLFFIGAGVGAMLTAWAGSDNGPIGNAATLAKWLVIGGAGVWVYRRYGR